MDESSIDSLERTSPEPADSPICLFYFSHPFAIGSHVTGPRSRTQATNNDICAGHLATNTEHIINKRRRRYRNSKTIAGNNTVSVRNRRRLSKKHSAWTLIKYLTESVRLHSRKDNWPRFEDVVDTLQTAWPTTKNFPKCSSDHEDTMAQSISQDKLSSGLPSPVLLRRRLSAPETIMRKHTLNQQRSDSTDSDSTPLSSISPLRNKPSSYSFWNRNSTTGSESNLSTRKTYKRDPDLMRKSTLLRRMWSREFTGSIGRLSNEEIFPKRTGMPIKSQSRTSLKSIRSSSPDAMKTNAIEAPTSSKSKWESASNSYSSYTSDTISRVSSTSDSHKSILETSSTDIKVSSNCTTTSTENEVFTTTRSTTATTGSNNANDNNSDSAYTNSHTYTSYSSSKTTSESNNNDTKPIDYRNSIKQPDNVQDNLQCNTQSAPDINSNHKTEVTEKLDQISELNIVNLNAATLNIIINNSPEIDSQIQSNMDKAKNPSIETIKKRESFFLKRKEDEPISADHSRIMKYMISNVGTGSPYTKSATQLVVPRYSALPRSTSMEVNTSADSTDKESDTASLVDSLDDPNSPRQSATPRIKHDDKPVRGDLSALLPDNSSSCRETPRTKVQKGSAFYVPIVQTKEETNAVKTVADHLPERVRNRLSKRQQKMEQKKHSTKNKTETSLDTNGNQSDITHSVSVPNSTETITSDTWPSNGTLRKIRKEKKIKNTLQSLPSYKINARGELLLNTNAAVKIKHGIKQSKRKYDKPSDTSETSSNSFPVRQPMWNHHAPLKSPTSNKIDTFSESSKNTPDKPQSNRIEILEIMECVDHVPVPEKQYFKSSGGRSKIPVLVQNKVPDIPHRQIQMHAIYHAYDLSQIPESSPKTDQLIANILIDALNTSDMIDIKPQEIPVIVNHSNFTLNEKRPGPMSSAKGTTNRYHQKFEIIPEEKLSSLGSSAEDPNSAEDKKVELPKDELGRSVEAETQVETSEASVSVQTQHEKKILADAASQTDLAVATTTDIVHRIPNAYKGRGALAVMKDEDFSTIPKGWITFYMLRKSPGSPDSSTDEGANTENKSGETEDKINLERQLRPVLIKRKLDSVEQFVDETTNMSQEINIVREDSVKRTLSLEHDSLVISKKDNYHSSSESSKSHSPTNEPELEVRSSCPLPIALPSRQGRRQSHRRGRYKTTQNQGTNASHIPGGWSVTVSGTNSCGQPAPDLEMRLKFPCAQPTSQSDSGLGEEAPRQTRRNFQQQPNATNNNNNNHEFHLPPAKPAPNKKYTVITRKHNDDLAEECISSRSFQYLPDLIKNKNQKLLKRRDASVPVTRSQSHDDMTSTSMPPLLKLRQPISGGLRPRQTLTSYRRFSLHHSSHLLPHFRTLLPNADASAVNARNLMELPECFPAILAVTGSAISPENKPRVSTMSEKDITRNHFNFGQHHA